MKAKYIATAILAVGAMISGGARDAKGIKIYINPGHGGHDSDDRNVVIAPYAQGDPNGYWESNSNLSKGLQLRDMLEAKGYTVAMSRVTNTTADDLNLGTIVKLSNEFGADLFFSIHSNATGVVQRRNFPLMLFRGYDNEPQIEGSLRICQILNKYLLHNQATYWTQTTENCRGDWSFYKSWGTQGLGALRGQNKTSMLSEGSFHDYIPEAYRLMSDDFCWLEAWHFRKAVDEYFDVPGLEVGGIAGRLNDTRVPRDGDYIKFGDDLFATIQNAKVELLDLDGKVLDTYTTHPIHTNGFYLFKNLNPGTYVVRASEADHYTIQDTIEVKANEISYLNMKMAKVRSTPPEVISYSPVWKDGDEPVLCNTPIVIQFNWDMDLESTEKAFKIDPPVEGKITWEDLNYRMVFTPTTPYDISTVYTVTIGTEAAHPDGLNMKEPVSFKFMTTDRNFMTILGHFPKDGDEVHYKNATIEFRFDKYPNTTPILQQVTAHDSQGNAVSFNKRGMSNSKNGSDYGFFRIPLAKDLTVGETYTVEVSGQMADKDGITIQAPVSVTFKAVDAGEAKTNLKEVDPMNVSENYSFTADASQGVTTATVAASSDKLFGDNATLFNYTFTDFEGGEALFSRNVSNDITIQPDATIGVHVNGDLTGNNIYLELTSETATQYIPLCTMDFLGWKYITVPATIEGPARLTGIKLAQNASQMSKTGKFVVDNIIASNTGSGVDDLTIESITLYPNPASEYLIANAGCFITGLDLISLNGTIVASTGGNVLNVSEVPEGTYIAVIKTASVNEARKVRISH